MAPITPSAPEIVAQIALAPPTLITTPTSAEGPSGPSGCVVKGAGETFGLGTKTFRVFTSRTDLEPALIVERPESIHVAWHDFPRAGTRGRAMASLGGQSLVRLDGYAELEGRRFQLTHRAIVAADHIWVRAGRTVELTGIDDDDALVVSSPTESFAPKTVRARAQCDDVVYQPDELTPEADVITAGDEVLLAPTTHLYDTPNGKQLLTLGTSYLNATKVDSRGGFVHIVASTSALAFDAWIPQRDVVADRALGSISGIGMTGGSSCGWGWSRIGTVIRETPLRIGTSPTVASTGAIERDARVHIAQSVTVEGEPWIAVSFVSREIEPAPTKSFWIAEADLRYD